VNSAFADAIASRAARIAVVGLGYVGMPLALAYARAGFTVIGFDVLESRILSLRAGQSHLMEIPSGTIAEHVKSGRFLPSADPTKLTEADVIFVCVPTPFDKAKAPDLSHVEAAARTIASVLRKGQLILLESTTYPGTTAEVLVPVLERSGLKAGVDFFVAFSPERIDPGNKKYTIENTSKVVGGDDDESAERAALVLQQVVKNGTVHRVSSTRAAELSKLLENTFRAVNIALVNELTMLCDRMGIDVWEVIDAAKTKPYGFMPFYPGPGVGGHCIPVDPYYLLWKAREFDFSTRFIQIAAETNTEMPFFTVDKIRRLLRDHQKPLVGAKLLVLGAAFKRDIDDARNSAAVRVMEILRKEGATVTYHDPHVPRIELRRELHNEAGGFDGLCSTELDDAVLRAVDCVVVLIGHSAVDYANVARTASLVFDAAHVLVPVPGGAVVGRL
jgi:UDP-N-acetyl-D-glucosamine dehydrogenase